MRTRQDYREYVDTLVATSKMDNTSNKITWQTLYFLVAIMIDTLLDIREYLEMMYMSMPED